MINLYKLNSTRRKRYEKQKNIFNLVLKRCHSKITTSGNQMKTECTFTIPPYIPGYPLFDIEECMRFLIYKLEKNKFKIKLINTSTIIVSWEHISLYERTDRQSSANQSSKYNQQKKGKKKKNFRSLYSFQKYSKYV